MRPEMNRKNHPFYGSHSIEKSVGDVERKLSKRDPQTMELEKRAKGIADKATKVKTCFDQLKHRVSCDVFMVNACFHVLGKQSV